jgi:Xaa-Pro dipeptidase
VAGQADYAGDVTSLPPTILAGENASAPHVLWGNRRFGANETVALELAGACRRYHAGLARTMQLGRPSRQVLETAKAVLEGMDAILSAIRPGIAAEEVHAAWNKVIGRYRLKKESRIGYAIGIGYPPDWGEHTISLRPGDRTILVPGNTLHCILGMWQEGWGLEVSETILITDTGAECLTNFPRDIHVK